MALNRFVDTEEDLRCWGITPPKGCKVFVVHLRRPKRSDPNESRSDPFFEFGSFGCTGCHGHNLMNPKHAEELRGARLAFAQGGHRGFRLVYLTPRIRIVEWGDRLEARWKPGEMPFVYEKAPVLVANGRVTSDFPLIEEHVNHTARLSIVGGFSSRFRARTKPLDDATAKQLIEKYDQWRAAQPDAIAETYEQSMPYAPPHPDTDRKGTYRDRIGKLKQARGGTHRKSGGCASKC